MVFKSRIGLFYIIAVILAILLLTISIIFSFSSSIIFPNIISICATVFLLSVTFNTKYTIQKEVLKYRSGPFSGKINILDIKALTLNTSQFMGLKIALAPKGIVIRYNKWDDIYISPKEEKLFVEALLKINPSITITHN